MSKDVIYLEQMLAAIDAINRYSNDIDEDAFLDNEMLCDACLMRLMVIGESTVKLSAQLKERFPGVEWRDMRLARNYYVHGYDTIGWIRVWATINTVLNPLRQKIEKYFTGRRTEQTFLVSNATN